MDIFKIRQELKTKSIFDIPLLVTFYARVSSEKDEQLNSLDNQVSYYKKFIESNTAWTYVEGYVDEGISGMHIDKRQSFQQMIYDAKQGKFDLIITKEISRFARNTLDSIKYTRELLALGVCVFFQNDNINTVDEDSELRLTIMSSIAQDELRKLSSRIKFGHNQAIKKGVVIGNSRIFGYKKDNKKLVIDEKEAPMVQLVFDLYSTDEYSMKQIEDILYEKGYRNHNGNKIYHTTLSNMIANPKYKGYYCGNKVKIIDMFTKQQKFLPESEWVMYKDETGEIVPAIVSEKVWDKANEVLKRRSQDVKKRRNISTHNNLLTGKMHCTCCNSLYYLKNNKADKNGNINSRWVCSGKIRSGAKSCKSFTIFENEIKEIIFNAFNTCIPNIDDLIEQYLKIADSITDENNIINDINKIKAQIEKEQTKQDKLLELVSINAVSTEDFQRMNNDISNKKSQLKDELQNLEDKCSLNADTKKYILSVTESLQETKETVDAPHMISRTFIEEYIDKINVTPIDSTSMDVEIKLFTGQNCKFPYNKPKSRTNKGFESNKGSTGHTALIKCPVQPMKFERIYRTIANHKMSFKYNVTIVVPI